MELIFKVCLSSDRSLQLDYVKLESLVIADQHAAVNTFPGLVHTARHTMGIGCTRSRWANPFREAGVYGVVGNWGEVVTRYPYRKVRMDHLLYRENNPKVETRCVHSSSRNHIRQQRARSSVG